jgi:hypothetical protein
MGIFRFPGSVKSEELPELGPVNSSRVTVILVLLISRLPAVPIVWVGTLRLAASEKELSEAVTSSQ